MELLDPDRAASTRRRSRTWTIVAFGLSPRHADWSAGGRRRGPRPAAVDGAGPHWPPGWVRTPPKARAPLGWDDDSKVPVAEPIWEPIRRLSAERLGALLRRPGAVHPGVDAAGADELAVVADLDDAPRPSTTTTRSAASAVESRWAMATEVRPRVRPSRARCTLTSVEGSTAPGGLVEDEQVGVGQVGAGDRDQLALPRRQRLPALTDAGRQTVRQPATQASSPSSVTASATSLVGGAGAPQADVLGGDTSKRKPSWGTSTTRGRSEAKETPRRSTPSMQDRALGRAIAG